MGLSLSRAVCMRDINQRGIIRRRPHRGRRRGSYVSRRRLAWAVDLTLLGWLSGWLSGWLIGVLVPPRTGFGVLSGTDLVRPAFFNFKRKFSGSRREGVLEDRSPDCSGNSGLDGCSSSQCKIVWDRVVDMEIGYTSQT